MGGEGDGTLGEEAEGRRERGEGGEDGVVKEGGLVGWSVGRRRASGWGGGRRRERGGGW